MADIELGVLFNTDRMLGPEFTEYAKRVEAAGIESVWLAELFGREPFVAAAHLLAQTSTLRVGTAIANVYARDATAAAAGAATLAEFSGDRFELGLGVSNKGLIEMRGHSWEPPVDKLTRYLEAIKAAQLAVPESSYKIQVAAHGPKMLAAAAAHADGVFTYLMNPEHTARTRSGIGHDAGLSPMMMCLECSDPEVARTLVRKAIGYYTGLDYYHRAWRTLGFDDADFADGGSDRLVDAIVAWGSIDEIKARIAEQHQAGATRVVVIPLNAAGGGKPDWQLLENLRS